MLSVPLYEVLKDFFTTALLHQRVPIDVPEDEVIAEYIEFPGLRLSRPRAWILNCELDCLNELRNRLRRGIRWKKFTLCNQSQRLSKWLSCRFGETGHFELGDEASIVLKVLLKGTLLDELYDWFRESVPLGLLLFIEELTRALAEAFQLRTVDSPVFLAEVTYLG